MAKPRVLIVDDDEDILMLIGIHFEKAGAEITKMNKPEEALGVVQAKMKIEESFDLIVVDIRMPSMDGNQLTRSIREAGYTGGIVAFTASATGQGKRESNEAGIDRYLDKTTLKQELVEAILAEYCSS